MKGDGDISKYWPRNGIRVFGEGHWLETRGGGGGYSASWDRAAPCNPEEGFARLPYPRGGGRSICGRGRDRGSDSNGEENPNDDNNEIYCHNDKPYIPPPTSCSPTLPNLRYCPPPIQEHRNAFCKVLDLEVVFFLSYSSPVSLPVRSLPVLSRILCPFWDIFLVILLPAAGPNALVLFTDP